MQQQWVIETKALTRRFGQQTAVNQVSLHVEPGRIYGLLGRNGAGKTCLMKMLLGLMAPTSGEIWLFGEKVTAPKREILCRIGSLIEAPGFYPNLTGTENLEILARIRGTISHQAVQRALDLVELPYRDKKRYRQYSLGMKQRLGIAGALLNDPELLILDEPTNGLDPIGIYAIRQLLRGLSADFGKAVLISSHQLAEMEQLVDDIGILQQGVLLEESDYQALVKRNGQCIYLKVGQLEKAALVLEHMGIHQYVVEEDAICIWEMTHESAAINRALVKAGVDVSVIMPRQDTLEDYFKQITGGVGIA